MSARLISQKLLSANYNGFVKDLYFERVSLVKSFDYQTRSIRLQRGLLDCFLKRTKEFPNLQKTADDLWRP